jgi:hypothetical protein
MIRFASSNKPMSMTFLGPDAKIVMHAMREAVREQHSKCRGLAIQLMMLKQHVESLAAEDGEPCDSECDVHDDPDECRGAAKHALNEAMEQMHNERMILKYLADANNSLVAQLRAFCRALPPLAAERGKGLEPIKIPTPEEMERLMRDIQGFSGLTKEDKQ